MADIERKEQEIPKYVKVREVMQLCEVSESRAYTFCSVSGVKWLEMKEKVWYRSSFISNQRLWARSSRLSLTSALGAGISAAMRAVNSWSVM